MVVLSVGVKQRPRQEPDMLTQEVSLHLQKYNFDLLARQEPRGRRCLRYMALAHIKDGKSASETALALRVTPRAVTQWLKWFVDEGLSRSEISLTALAGARRANVKSGVRPV